MTLARKTRIKPRRSKPRRGRVRNAAYLGWIRTLPCLVCSSWPVEAAHTGARGFGMKADDVTAIPLCSEHHRTGRTAHHVLGRRFWDAHEIDRDEVIADLNARYEQTMRASDAIPRRGE